jgi:gliding motility-associated-like protein
MEQLELCIYYKTHYSNNKKVLARLFFHSNFFFHILIANIFSFLFFQQLNAQDGNLIINGSFDYSKGFPGDVLSEINPDNWSICIASTPDIYKKYTFQSDNSTLLPVTDNTFAAIRARGANSFQYNPVIPATTNEYLSQQLAKPISKLTCYLFSVYLCSDLRATERGGYQPTNSDPLELKVWGSNNPCSREKLLFVTQPVNNTFWKKFQVYFSVLDTSYKYITLDIIWDTTNSQNQQNGGLLFLDDARIDSFGPANVTKIDTAYYKGNNKTTLTALDGDTYLWSPESKLSKNNTQSTIVENYSDVFSVIIGHNNSCPDYQIFNLKMDCESLYPQKILDTINVFYTIKKKTVLNADTGYYFNWEPQTGLSEYNIKSPFLTGYSENFYIVNITDKFNCVHKEMFNIIYNCDTIVSEKSFSVLDTVLTNKASIKLIPTYGTLNGYWSPNEWLSCNDCQEPIASPLNEVTYSVKLKDEYNCLHQENFKIGVELYVPNVITPNGDGYNDCFKIVGLPEETTINIYNKSGALVFTSNSYNESNCWDGRDLSGKQLETGTFWYSLAKPKSGLLKKGFVFLKR